MRWIDAVVQWLSGRSVKCDFGMNGAGSIPGPGSPKNTAGVAQRKSAYTPTFATSTLTGPIEGRLSAHNGEDVGSKPTTGIISNSAGLQNLPGASSPHTLNRHGAAVSARGS